MNSKGQLKENMKEELRKIIELLEEAKELNYIRDFALIGGLALSVFFFSESNERH